MNAASGDGAAQAWADLARAGTAALMRAVDAADWNEAAALAAGLATLLQTPPPDAGAVVVPIYQQAHAVLQQASAAAVTARESARASLKQLGKGRKAVSAYA